MCVTADFRRDADEIYTLLRHYIAYSDNSLPTFRDNLSVPSQRIKKSDPNFLLTFRDNLSVPPSRVIGKEASTYFIQKCVVHFSFVLVSLIYKRVTFYFEKHSFPTSVFLFAIVEVFIMSGIYRDNNCTNWRKFHVCSSLGNIKKQMFKEQWLTKNKQM
jgi:hypothetical protein